MPSTQVGEYKIPTPHMYQESFRYETPDGPTTQGNRPGFATGLTEGVTEMIARICMMVQQLPADLLLLDVIPGILRTAVQAVWASLGEHVCIKRFKLS